MPRSIDACMRYRVLERGSLFMNEIPRFEEFDKIPRLSRGVIVTEKIDGTNAQILIADDQKPFYHIKMDGPPVPFLCGSRTKWIFPGEDNSGFAAWAYKNSEELLKLGPGRHFGEWWGSGIQRGYALPKGEKRFSLFNTGRWYVGEKPAYCGEAANHAPACCSVVPVLAWGPFSHGAVDEALAQLRERGSVAAPGFMKPEGVVVYHTAANSYFKKTLEKDEQPKSLS